MAYTALNLITDTLLDMGVIADETLPTASQSVGALTKLNDLIGAWNLDPLAVFGANQFVMPLVANKQAYTIGPGGDLNIIRPDIITQAFARNITQSLANQTDYPLPILTNQEWAEIPQKGNTGGYPFLGVWFNLTFPLITAYISPIPRDAQYSLVFWADGMNGVLALNTVMQLPPGYNRALKYALYLELAGGYQIQIPPKIEQLAASSKAGVDRHNLQLNELKLPRRGRFDIYSGLIRYPV